MMMKTNLLILCLLFCKSFSEIPPCPGGDDNVCNDNQTNIEAAATSSTIETSLFGAATTTTTEEEEEEDEGIDLKVDFDNIGIIKSVNTSATQKPNTTTPFVVVQNTTRQINLKKNSNSKVCPCDLMVLNCDINCCCDPDCEDYQLDAFSHCYNVLPNNYDSRYCYNKNFIKTKFNTQFILDRIADNLFCIAKDNLPPLDSAINSMSIKTRKTFDDYLMRNNFQNKYSWLERETMRPASGNINVSSLYIHGDVFWTIKNNSIEKFKLPLRGFTGQCSMKKQIEYFKDWESSCLQINLNNNNLWIFLNYHSNMTILSSPKYLNTSAKLPSLYQDCPKNICIPIETNICMNSSSDSCSNSTEVPRTMCINGTCINAVKKFQYTVYHNGSSGIKNIKLKIELGNFSRAFHQYFGIKFQWSSSKRDKVLLARSGNPGYVLGKPIITGIIMSVNNTSMDQVAHDYINLNYTLQVPIASRKNGRCSRGNKYSILFGENVKSKCSISMETYNFSSTTCNYLHQQILDVFFDNSLINVTDVDNYRVYISRSGNVSNLNSSDWSQILLNRIPNNSITGQTYQTKNQCSGLATSLTIDILYGLLPKTANEDHYKIVGIGMTISDQQDIVWDKKCPNCTDILNVDIISYVNFRDISTSGMYYYAGGPNLNLILSYDFFYPFLSRNNSSIRLEFSILLFIITGFIHLLF